jgi:putative transposase
MHFYRSAGATRWSGELADDGIPVATPCRILSVSTSGCYAWRDRPPSSRQQADAALSATIAAAHAASYGPYGARRVHAELRLGQGVHCGRNRVERPMHTRPLQGVHRRRLRGCTGHDLAAIPRDDLVQRRFTVAEPTGCGARTPPSIAAAKAGANIGLKEVPKRRF